MKTAEEWAKLIDQTPNSNEVGEIEAVKFYSKRVKQIQLEAMKEGMLRAADMATRRSDGTQGISNARKRLVNEIITASEKLK